MSIQGSNGHRERGIFAKQRTIDRVGLLLDFFSGRRYRRASGKGGLKFLYETGKALFAWQAGKRRFRLESVHPDCSANDVRANTGFDYDAPETVPVTPEPDAAALALMRGAVADEIAANDPEFARRVWRKTT